MQLYPYQEKAKRNIYNSFRSGKQSVMLQLPTGGGKTVIFSSIINDGVKSNRRVLLLAHRSELIQQAYDKLHKGFGIKSGIIKANHPTDTFNSVQIASVPTLVNRNLVKAPDIVIIDEAHHDQQDNSYGKIRNKVLELNPNAKFLGVTATPCRTNGSGFAGIYDELIQAAQMSELIRDSFLVQPKYFVAPIELGKIKTTGGDYNLKELSEVYQRKVQAEDLVRNWIEIAEHRQTIGFAVDVAHSKSIVNAYQKAGIRAAHVDGTTPEHIRKSTVYDFAEKRIQVLYNVSVFTEGYDCPGIEAEQLARPTKSLSLYLQMVGRALRAAKGKMGALILDHAGLVAEHDLAEIDRIWTLEGVKKANPNRVLVYEDTQTGRQYALNQLPLDMPMNRIRLVEYVRTPQFIKSANNLKAIDEINKLIYIQKSRNLSSNWVWHRLTSKIEKTDKIETKENLEFLADLFVTKYSFKTGYKYVLIKNFLEINFPEKQNV